MGKTTKKYMESISALVDAVEETVTANLVVFAEKAQLKKQVEKLTKQDTENTNKINPPIKGGGKEGGDKLPKNHPLYKKYGGSTTRMIADDKVTKAIGQQLEDCTKELYDMLDTVSAAKKEVKAAIKAARDELQKFESYLQAKQKGFSAKLKAQIGAGSLKEASAFIANARSNLKSIEKDYL